ncbi:hypothetical protein EBZ80_16965 [bacterium]|nr:hypothetical protein [bacterium]
MPEHRTRSAARGGRGGGAHPPARAARSGRGGGAARAPTRSTANHPITAQQQRQWKDTTCKEWESKCPSSANLEGDEWCEAAIRTGRHALRTPDWSFCTSVEEMLSLIHSAFTAMDTIIGAPRLDMPRDPYTRRYLPKDFYEKLHHALETGGFTPAQIQDWIARYPEVFVFLCQTIQNPDELFTEEFARKDKYAKNRIVREKLERPFHAMIVRMEVQNGAVVWRFAGAPFRTLRGLRPPTRA